MAIKSTVQLWNYITLGFQKGSLCPKQKATKLYGVVTTNQH